MGKSENKWPCSKAPSNYQKVRTHWINSWWPDFQSDTFRDRPELVKTIELHPQVYGLPYIGENWDRLWLFWPQIMMMIIEMKEKLNQRMILDTHVDSDHFRHEDSISRWIAEAMEVRPRGHGIGVLVQLKAPLNNTRIYVASNLVGVGSSSNETHVGAGEDKFAHLW